MPSQIEDDDDTGDLGLAPVKLEGSPLPYDKHYLPELHGGRFTRLVRHLTRWAWEPLITHGQQARAEVKDARKVTYLREVQLALLEELFREKQGKISRLQASYAAKGRVLYEDLRKENPIKDAESIAQTISVLALRAERIRASGKPAPRYSDGTVLGVPGDRENIESGEGW